MVKDIQPKDVQEKLEKGETLNIIDVREDEEVAEGMIPEAKHIPLGDVEDRLDEIDKGQEHIMVCRSGGRSGKAAKYLEDKGYNVLNMEGGMLAYEGGTKPKL
ncbi:rhodanese-like domain-containing protein [Tuberibacillus sp. Marseille-P3662]|uniref:rhodanese-like domain-containing protein n=1 Tax=Tuberibacillus sp. Marseille-P3662 TaxID=1965358 RepID=UPI000A1CDF42